MQDAERRIHEALKMLVENGQYDGARHKMWAIDQAVRLLTGCPKIEGTVEIDGKHYADTTLGESEEYRAALTKYCDIGWDTGIQP